MRRQVLVCSLGILLLAVAGRVDATTSERSELTVGARAPPGSTTDPRGVGADST